MSFFTASRATSKRSVLGLCSSWQPQKALWLTFRLFPSQIRTPSWHFSWNCLQKCKCLEVGNKRHPVWNRTYRRSRSLWYGNDSKKWNCRTCRICISQKLQNFGSFGKTVLLGERVQHFRGRIVQRTLTDLCAVTDCYRHPLLIRVIEYRLKKFIDKV